MSNITTTFSFSKHFKIISSTTGTKTYLSKISEDDENNK